MTTHVPTNGFAAPPAAPAAVAPAAPAVPQGGFQVPPAGAPAQVPAQPSGNGTPITPPGMQPGWVQQPQGTVPAHPQGTQPAQQTQAPAQPAVDVAALVQAALAEQKAAEKPAPTEQPRPEWMGTSANDFDVNTIENPTIRAMATVLQTAGKDLDLDRVLGKALVHGDASLVDVAYLAEKGGAQAAQLTQIAKGIVDAVNAESERITSEVYALAGGEAQWSAAASAFNQSAPQELRAVVAQMLNSTSPQQIKAGAKLVAEFGKQSGMLPQQGAALLQTAAGSMNAQGLSAADFKTELAKLNPNSANFIQEREALFARRQLGRRTGM